MPDVTRMLGQLEAGDRIAAEELLPQVYEELRKLAAARLACERPGQTLQATALVHEAYLRLVGVDSPPHWENQRHFFAAAAEAMRRILVERARQRQTDKHGGGRQRVELDAELAVDETREPELLALDEALDDLQQHDPQAAELVKLRYFAGLSHQQAASALGMGRRQADRIWAIARAWLYLRLKEE